MMKGMIVVCVFIFFLLGVEQGCLAIEPVNQSGIPAGTTCQPTSWCDHSMGLLLCSTVCATGSVEIDSWQTTAIYLQTKLARQLSVCYAVLDGTHNSAITLANGYGNSDALYDRYLHQIPDMPRWSTWRTNNQWLSLTDQLRLGVRSLELDTHWFLGNLHIAHCGGVDLPDVNNLIDELNQMLLKDGLQPVDWDTETLGCDPPFSNIPAKDQRTFASALQEVVAWMTQPENLQEFVVLMLDCEDDLATWNKLPLLEQQLNQYVGATVGLVTTNDIQSLGGFWPPLQRFVDAGKRVLVTADCNVTGANVVFLRETVCGWTEPDLSPWQTFPTCIFQGVATNQGQLVRMETDAIQYGPFNSGGSLGRSIDLNTTQIAQCVQCSLNMPAPDYYTTEMSQATIWTWAPNEPSLSNISSACVVLDATLAGRWLTLSSCDQIPVACLQAPGKWLIQPPSSSSSSSSSSCASGTFSIPFTAYDNSVLLSFLKQSSFDQVQINYSLIDLL